MESPCCFAGNRPRADPGGVQVSTRTETAAGRRRGWGKPERHRVLGSSGQQWGGTHRSVGQQGHCALQEGESQGAGSPKTEPQWLA